MSALVVIALACMISVALGIPWQLSRIADALESIDRQGKGDV
jgi:hypothetical protein